MSNYYFDVTAKFEVCIPLDQVTDENGDSLDETYSKEEIQKALLDEIDFAAEDCFKDKRYTLEVDSEELNRAVSLFYSD